MKKVTAPELIAMLEQEGDIGTSEFTQQLVDTLRYYDNMSGEKFRAPNLANATPGFLIDEFGEMKAEIGPRKTYETVLKDALNRHREKEGLVSGTVLAGEKYVVTFNWVSKMIMDPAAIANYLSNPEAFIAAHGGSITVEDFKKVSEYWEARSSLKPTEVK